MIGHLPSLLLLERVYHILWCTMTYHNHENKSNPKNKQLGQDGTCPIQKSGQVWSNMYGTRHFNGCGDRCVPSIKHLDFFISVR